MGRWPLLLLLAVMCFYGAADTGLFDHEAQALWVVQDVASTRAAPADAIRAVRANLTSLADRLPQADQPALYFLILDAWTSISGESLAAARALSLLAGLLAYALIASAARYWTGRSAALPILLLSGAVMLYAGRGVYLYALLLMFSALALWSLLYWQQTRQKHAAAIYTLALAACLGTAYGALCLLPLHAWIAYRSGDMRRWLPLMLAALLAAAPLALLSRPVASFIAVDLHVVIAPALLAALPPGIVELAARWRGGPVPALLAVLALGAGFALDAQRPDWVRIIDQMSAARHPLDVTVTRFAPESALAYYDRQPGTRVRRGISLMLGWREHPPEELLDYAARLANAPGVWLALPEDSPEAEVLLPALLAERPLMWQREAGGIYFYQFEAAQGSE